MEYGKYITIEYMGHIIPILFHPLIPHNEVVGMNSNIKSAGFFRIDTLTVTETAFQGSNLFSKRKDISVTTFGSSTMLQLESKKEDEELIKKILIGK